MTSDGHRTPHSHASDHHDGHEHLDDAHDGHGHDVHAKGIAGALRALFGPHRHDAAETVDRALRDSREGMRALEISLAVLAVTAALQVVVVLVSGSVALLADTVHNFADALTAVPLGFAFWLGRRRPSKRYTYGYGRAEDLAGIF